LHADGQIFGRVFVGHFRDLQIRHNVFNKVILPVGFALKETNELCSVEHYMTPRELQDVLEDLTASRQSRRRVWENLQEIRWVIKDTTGIDLPPSPRKTIDAEGSLIVDAVRKAVRERQAALAELVHAVRAFRQADEHPLNREASGYAQVLHKLHGAIDRAEGLLQ
jgi:hypothetical protein